MANQSGDKDTVPVMAVIVMAAIIVGIVTCIFFLIIDKDSYSSIYIMPDSIVHNSTDNSVLFTYGVKSSETGVMNYTLNIYSNSTLVKTKQFTLGKGEILDERSKIVLPPDVEYPCKISLQLSTKATRDEVHFWLNG